MTRVADLLHLEPQLTLDGVALSQTLTFSFATGGTGEDLERLLNRARVAPSQFRAEAFARDLFLLEVVQRCLTVTIEGRERPLRRAQLLRELSHPCVSLQSLAFRQGILRELSEAPALRRALEQLWLGIEALRGALESADRSKRFDAIARRVEILKTIKDAIDLLGGAFEGATSGLSRVAELGRGIRAGAEFHDLCEFLDHEGHLATLDLRVSVGRGGEVRGFEILRAHENSSNRFHTSPWRRFVTRVRMLFGGYRLRESEIAGRLTNHVFDGVQDAVIALFQLGLHCEFYLAALGLRDVAAARGLAVCLPELTLPNASADGAQGSSLVRLFNPLLLLEKQPPRPCDLRLGPADLVIITGPNSGGKTRLLQALGLTQLLGQAGYFVPAAEARLVWRDGLFVSLIQESGAEQPEGRLGMELLRIRRLFEQLGFNSLVIMDELCSGTNPSEGEEIFQLVVTLLSELEPQALITTHFLQFAERLALARPAPNLAFLQVELDAHNEPTYGFVPGVAPTSLAGRTAERLGVTREALEALVEQRRRQHAAWRSASQLADNKPHHDEHGQGAEDAHPHTDFEDALHGFAGRQLQTKRAESS